MGESGNETHQSLRTKRNRETFVGKKENLAVSSELSPAAANKEVIGLVVTDGNKYRIILFEPTAGKAIVEGGIGQLNPDDKDISYINWSAL